MTLAIAVVVTLAWLGFAGVVVTGHATEAWAAFHGWPDAMQITTWVVALPFVAGGWLWNTSWPLWLRALAVGGVAWATLYAFWSGVR